MTARRRFDVNELRPAGAAAEPDAGDAELAGALAMARELEAMATADPAQPTSDFEDRVMATIATEPAPRAVIRPGTAVLGGRLGAIALTVRESWGVAFNGGRPLTVRAQALAVLLIAVLAVGLLTTAGAATVGGLLQGRSTPPPSTAPFPTPVPSPTAPPIVSPSPTTGAAPTTTETAEPTETPEPTGTGDPVRTPRPTRTSDNSGPGGGGGSTPKPAETPEPTGTDDHGGGGSSGDHGGSGGSGPSGSEGPGPG